MAPKFCQQGVQERHSRRKEFCFLVPGAPAAVSISSIQLHSTDFQNSREKKLDIHKSIHKYLLTTSCVVNIPGCKKELTLFVGIIQNKKQWFPVTAVALIANSQMVKSLIKDKIFNDVQSKSLIISLHMRGALSSDENSELFGVQIIIYSASFMPCVE